MNNCLPMLTKNFIITGPPRSGSTLLCSLLSKIDNVVALNEPMRLSDFTNPLNAISAIDHFFVHWRRELINNQAAPARGIDGKTPDNQIIEHNNKRINIATKQLVSFDKKLDNDFHLGIKHNIHFSFLLEELKKKYSILVIVRNPLSTLLSWNSTQIPVSQGEPKVLKTLYAEYYQQLMAITAVEERQVRLLLKMFENYQNNPEVILVKYESLIQNPNDILSKITGKKVELISNYESKNSNRLYDFNKAKKYVALLQSLHTHELEGLYDLTLL